jgi:hypothetical protein
MSMKLEASREIGVFTRFHAVYIKAQCYYFVPSLSPPIFPLGEYQMRADGELDGFMEAALADVDNRDNLVERA